MAGPAKAASPAPMSSTDATSWKGATGMPSPAMNCFSVSRSCETASALAPGRTGTRVLSRSAAAIGTFSNS